MKKVVVVFLSFIFISTTFAQNEYKQKEFIFSTGGVVVNDPEDLDAALGECLKGVATVENVYNIHDINPTWGVKTPIYSVETLKRNGKVVNNEERAIGTLLQCQDWQTYWPQRLVVPVYYEITISGKKYRAAGAGTSPDFADLEFLPGGGSPMVRAGYPENGVSYLNYYATVLPGIPGKIGGTFQIGNLGFVDGVPREQYDHASSAILRVLIPMKDGEN